MYGRHIGGKSVLFGLTLLIPNQVVLAQRSAVANAT
jgi:hypothetical protein